MVYGKSLYEKKDASLDHLQPAEGLNALTARRLKSSTGAF